MCLFQLWCLIVNYQSGLDLRWDICSWNSSPGRGQMSGGEETKGLNLKEQQEKRKRRWEGGKKKKNQRLSAFGSVICSLQIKWAGSALNLPRVCRQSSSIKGSHLLLRCSWHCCCSSGSSQGCTWGTMEKLFCLLFQSNTWVLLSASLCLRQVSGQQRGIAAKWFLSWSLGEAEVELA